MEERLDILDRFGNHTGESETKSRIKKGGIWHHTVHIWMLNEKNQILLQKRADDKPLYPGLWDISVGGHIHAGESKEKAAIREIAEEIQLDITEDRLEYQYTIRNCKMDENGIEIRAFNHIFITQLNSITDSISADLEEVQDLKWVDADELKKLFFDTDRQGLVPHGDKYYSVLLSILNNYL
jgi:isopentenyldiphosphate isomerase